MEETLYNINIERSVLNSIIFEPSQFEDVEAKLQLDDFYLPAHQEIYTAMLELHRESQPIDEEFIKKRLNVKKRFDEGIMLDILSSNPISNTIAYVQEIKDKAVKRKLLTLTTEIKRVTVEEDLPSLEVIDIVEKKLYEITQSNENVDFKDAPSVAFDTMEYIKEMKARGNSVLVGVDTGFAELNKMTTGFGKGDLVIIAARPAMGKTSFALNIVLNQMQLGNGVAFFSLEMPAEQLMLRLLSAHTSIFLQKLRVGDLNDEEWSRLKTSL